MVMAVGLILEQYSLEKCIHQDLRYTFMPSVRDKSRPVLGRLITIRNKKHKMIIHVCNVLDKYCKV